MNNAFFKTIVVLFFSFLFVGCSVTNQSFNYAKDEKHITFKLDKNSVSSYAVYDAKIQYKHNGCVRNAYTLESKSLDTKLMIEHIQLDPNCEWNGLERGFYSYLIEKKTKSKSMDLLQKIEINEFEFLTYKTAKNCLVYLISISPVDSVTFVVDKVGSVYKDLLLKLKPNYEFPEFKSQCSVDFKSSLMDESILSNYYFDEQSN